MSNFRKNRQNKDLIEICHEKCLKNDSDVYVFRKTKCKAQQNIFEVELKHPKCKVYAGCNPPATKETQIDEIELAAAYADICAGKRKKKRK